MTTVAFRPPITVYVAHPDAAVRATIRDEVLGQGITIVGEAPDGREALVGIIDLAPDVALLAVHPELDGPAVCAELRKVLPVCRVLLVAADDDDDAAARGLEAGAYGCYVLSDPAVPLPRAIRGTMRRESLPTPAWARRILAMYAELAAQEDARIVPAPRLTPTEQEVLNRIAASAHPAAIADLHGVTTHMVRLHAGYAIIKLYRAIADERQLQALK